MSKIEPTWFKIARNLGAKPWHMLGQIIVPAVAQDMLTGMRFALGVAWIVLVPAEFLGVTSGLGYAIKDARETLEYSRLGAMVLSSASSASCSISPASRQSRNSAGTATTEAVRHPITHPNQEEY